MLAGNGELLYVGKALDLRRRVGSYFQKGPKPHRQATMLAQVASMDTTITATEAEALVLESRLIKSQSPRYNIALRDDAGYPYLHLSTDQAVPRIRLHRGSRGRKGAYFGPYPDREAARAGLDAVVRGFGIRTCTDSFFRHRTRPCLEYQIGRCSGPCVQGLVSPQAYAKAVSQAHDFLSGRSQAVFSDLIEQMEQAATLHEYERAAALRDRISRLRRVQSRIDVQSASQSRDAVAIACSRGQCVVVLVPFRDGHASQAQVFHPRVPAGNTENEVLSAFLMQHYLERRPPQEILLDHAPASLQVLTQALTELAGHAVRLRIAPRGDRAHQLALATRNAQAAHAQHEQSQALLATRRADLARLLDLPRAPERIECFDISHTQGEATRAACVVFGPDGPLKQAWRHYRIDNITPGDDYAAMRQALSRRFTHSGPLPDLLLIDGGAGQVQQALDVLSEHGLSLPVVGIAKGPERKTGHEDLILASQGRILHPGPHSPGLLLLAAVRDQAHRFAITGHRRARDKARTGSVLEQIPGVGPARRRALLVAFGGLSGIRRASLEELMRVPGIDRALASRVWQHLSSGAP